MRARWAGIRGIAGLGLLALAACMTAPAEPTATPRPRPATVPAPSPQVAQAQPSAQSQNLARYYSRVQADLLARGLLRVGGGGIDTPYTETDLMRNFERLAFYDEYAQGGGLRRSDGGAGKLRKWSVPVRMNIEFGASVPEAQRAGDRAIVQNYAARLARVTGHPIRIDNANPNFNVMIVGEDDRQLVLDRLMQIDASTNSATIGMVRSLPRSIHCIVVAYVGTEVDYGYVRAVALIRAEHPELTRRACVHEELAQGLGLANDSPRARPSIFNDDDEFALLTTHDEELLRLLYNPALSPGMSADEARPILRRLVTGQGGPS